MSDQNNGGQGKDDLEMDFDLGIEDDDTSFGGGGSGDDFDLDLEDLPTPDGDGGEENEDDADTAFGDLGDDDDTSFGEASDEDPDNDFDIDMNNEEEDAGEEAALDDDYSGVDEDEGALEAGDDGISYEEEAEEEVAASADDRKQKLRKILMGTAAVLVFGAAGYVALPIVTTMLGGGSHYEYQPPMPQTEQIPGLPPQQAAGPQPTLPQQPDLPPAVGAPQQGIPPAGDDLAGLQVQQPPAQEPTGQPQMQQGEAQVPSGSVNIPLDFDEDLDAFGGEMDVADLGFPQEETPGRDIDPFLEEELDGDFGDFPASSLNPGLIGHEDEFDDVYVEFEESVPFPTDEITDMFASVQGSMDELLYEVRTISSKVEAIENNFVSRVEVDERFDDVEERLASMEAEIAKLATSRNESVTEDFGNEEASSSQAPTPPGLRAPDPKPENAPVAVAEKEKPKAEMKAAAAPKKAASAPRKPARAARGGNLTPPLKPMVVEGYALRGVVGNKATIETSQGFMEVARGDTIPGVGSVLAVTHVGGEWVVATPQGVIVP